MQIHILMTGIWRWASVILQYPAFLYQLKIYTNGSAKLIK